MMTDMETIIRVVSAELGARASNGRPLIAAVDGRCASGKTTLALHLRETMDCTVFHMDEFFLRPEQRTSRRLAEPGGNVDYERFLQEVLLPLETGCAELTYRAFDCHTMSLLEPETVRIAPIIIVEGSYSCHPALREHYGMRIFMTTGREEQLRRITARNGADGAERFRDLWIPLEEKYFESCGVEKCCELRFET